MTTRGLGLLLIILAILAASAAAPVLFWPAVALLVGAAIASIVDWRRAPGASQLHVERTVEDLISVGADTDVVIRATATRPVRRAIIRDISPPEFDSTQEIKQRSFPAEIRYRVRAKARGDADFGDVVVRADGPLGLAWRQSTISAAKQVHVNADVSAISHYQALARRGLLAEVGVRTLRRRGEGTEFERIREAVPDDSLRSINWRATARTGRLMAIDVIPERAQPVVIALDHGRLMGVGAGNLTKLDHAINASVLLAHVCISSGDRVGLFAFAERVTTTLPSASGHVQMKRFVDALRPLVPTDVESDYDHALVRLSQFQKRRALVVIFSDVIDADQVAALARQCARLRRHHIPLVITVRDPALVDIAAEAPIDGNTTYRRALAITTQKDRSAAIRLLRAAGADAIDVDARTLSPSVVNRYLEIKRAGRL